MGSECRGEEVVLFRKPWSGDRNKKVEGRTGVTVGRSSVHLDDQEQVGLGWDTDKSDGPWTRGRERWGTDSQGRGLLELLLLLYPFTLYLN